MNRTLVPDKVFGSDPTGSSGRTRLTRTRLTRETLDAHRFRGRQDCNRLWSTEKTMTDEADDNVTPGGPAQSGSTMNPPAKSGGGGGATIALFFSVLALAASVGSTGWILMRAQPAVRTATSTASALADEVKSSAAASRETAASYDKLGGAVASIRAELVAIAQLPARAEGLDKRIPQAEAGLGALARVAAADMAGRSMAAAASGAVLAQNDVSRLVTLASSIPETAAAAELGTVLPGGTIARQSLKTDLSHIVDRIEAAAAPQPQSQPQSAVHTVQTFINRTVN